MSLPDVILDLVTAAVPDVPVHDGHVPTFTDRYVVLWADPGTVSAQDVAHTSDLVQYRFRLTYVTGGAQAGRRSVAWLAGHCRAALIDVMPTVPGWVFGPIELESTAPIQVDPDSETTVLYGVDSFVVLGARA